MNGPDEALIPHIVARFQALADANRIRLLMALKEGECRVGDLAAQLGLAQAATSRQLGILRQAGLVQVRRSGNQAFYHLRDRGILDLCDQVCSGVRRLLSEEYAAVDPHSPPPVSGDGP